MKIGILTFHDAHNYGAMLQCYALQQFLISEGHNVEVIDYRPKFYEEQYRYHKLRAYIGKNPLHTIKSIYYNYYLFNKRCAAFSNFHSSYLHMSEPATRTNIPQDYDAYIVGSDQIWNPELTNGFHDVYFCDFCFPKEKRRFISYAPSMEIRTLSKEDSEYLSRTLNRFDTISVREASLIPLLKPLVNHPIQQVLDPTLLLDVVSWKILIGKSPWNNPYVVLYQIREDPAIRLKAFEIAKSINGVVVELTARIDHHYPTKYQTASPIDFITYIYHAAYVITTSFHGTAFSLIFNRSFYTYRLGDNFDSRSMSLLQSVGLIDRLVRPDDRFEATKVDFRDANKKLEELRQLSHQFLATSLQDK